MSSPEDFVKVKCSCGKDFEISVYEVNTLPIGKIDVGDHGDCVITDETWEQLVRIAHGGG